MYHNQYFIVARGQHRAKTKIRFFGISRNSMEFSGIFWAGGLDIVNLNLLILKFMKNIQNSRFQPNSPGTVFQGVFMGLYGPRWVQDPQILPRGVLLTYSTRIKKMKFQLENFVTPQNKLFNSQYWFLSVEKSDENFKLKSR